MYSNFILRKTFNACSIIFHNLGDLTAQKNSYLLIIYFGEKKWWWVFWLDPRYLEILLISKAWMRRRGDPIRQIVPSLFHRSVIYESSYLDQQVWRCKCSLNRSDGAGRQPDRRAPAQPLHGPMVNMGPYAPRSGLNNAHRSSSIVHWGRTSHSLSVIFIDEKDFTWETTRHWRPQNTL